MSVVLDYSDDCAEPRDYYLGADDHGVILRTGCNRRFEVDCPSCSRKWQRKVRHNYETAIRHFKSPKFLTLTLTKRRSGYENLRRIWSLRKDLFRRLRDDGYAIAGWVGVLEWPNHVHMVIDCDGYIPQYEISRAWRTITGDSYVVDVRALKRQRGGLEASIRYISKYITKFGKIPGLNMDFFRKLHLVGSWGLVHEPTYHPICPICLNSHPWRHCSADEYYGQGWDRIYIVPDDVGT